MREEYTPEVIARFWSRVDRSAGPDACWLWVGGTFHSFGYGVMKFSGKNHGAHRIAFELSIGPIAEGLCVCHSCDNPSCCNPRHLWLGTSAENTADRVAKGRSARGEKMKCKTYHYGSNHWSNRNPERVARGERQGRARLTDDDVREIRRRYAQDSATLTVLGREFGVTKQAIALIVKRKNWAHVE